MYVFIHSKNLHIQNAQAHPSRLNKTFDFVFTSQTKITLTLASTPDCCKCVVMKLYFNKISFVLTFLLFCNTGSPTLVSARRRGRIIQLIRPLVISRASIGNYILNRLRHRPSLIHRRQRSVNRGQGSVVQPMNAISRQK